MIEKILKFSIYNRFLVVLLTAAAAAYGIYSLKNLPIDAVPDITNNQVQINATAPGLSPYEVEKQVTFAIENTLAGIPGLESMRSISRNGFSQVTAIFDEDVNVYFARQQINERIAEAKDLLPVGVEPKMGPISTGLGEIYMYTIEYEHPLGKGAKVLDGHAGWQSNGSYLTPEGHHLKNETELASYLRTVQDWIIRPQLNGIRGLAGVDSIGGYVRQYHVEPNIERLSALGLNFQDLITALENNNLSIGAGHIEHNNETYLVKADGRIETPEQIEDVVIATRKGIPIHIKDVAAVAIGKELRTGSATENGQEVVIGTAMMLIGANSRTVALSVDEKMQQINKTLPPDVKAKTILNRTKLVDATIETVTKNLLEGALLVIVVLFAMLGNFRAAFITALIIPLSMLLTAIGMVKTHISGNLMSLGALDFGLIVDGAVIITENCIRKLAEKQKSLGRLLNLNERLEEVAIATKEMIQPTVFGQAIILTVYFPLLTFSSVEGKMFEPMAMTVIFALLAALVLSLTFTPAMIAIFVTKKIEENENKINRWTKSCYAPLLEKALQAPGMVVAYASLMIAASLLFFSHLGQEFIPALDEKDIALHAVRIPSTSLSQSTAMQLDVEKTLKKFPQVAFVFSKTGTAEMASDPMPPNVSDTFVMLTPPNEWPNPNLSKNDLIAQLEEQLKLLPGNNYEFTQPIEMRFNELIAGVRSDVAVRIFGDDFDKMQRVADDIANTLRKIKGAADVKVAQTDGLPVLEVKVNREASRRLGISTNEILNTISIAIGGGKAGMILEGDRRFDLVVRLPEDLRQNPEALGNLPIALPGSESQNGYGFTPLKEVAHIAMTEGINEITRENGKRAIIVQANVRGNDLGSFVATAKKNINAQVKVPPGYWLDWGGQFENLISARNHLLVVVPICFALILILLFTALKSVKESLIVFSGVPMALTGGIMALWLRDMPFSISAAVGFIALSGIAVLNGLVMVTYINQLMQTTESTIQKAVFQGALARLRPVLMTALVASLGFVPMAFASGTGAEVQKPLATVVIGGLISATFLTLFVLPCLYLLCHSRSLIPVHIYVDKES